MLGKEKYLCRTDAHASILFLFFTGLMIYSLSHETSVILDEVINWVILNLKCYVNVGPILNHYGAISENWGNKIKHSCQVHNNFFFSYLC